MFHIKTKIKTSKIHGLGLFADEKIMQGQRVYTVNETLDLILPNQDFLKLNINEQSVIKHYGYFDKKSERWHLAFDDIRFCNHNKDSNLTLIEKSLIAKRDISNGEELTQDYREFEKLRQDLEN